MISWHEYHLDPLFREKETAPKDKLAYIVALLIYSRTTTLLIKAYIFPIAPLDLENIKFTIDVLSGNTSSTTTKRNSYIHETQKDAKFEYVE